jgi:ubiquinone/menaquinone biosynthesis C-methylase UbiE
MWRVKMENQEKKPFSVFDIWEKLGVTEHMGGIKATRQLIELCNITSGQSILDIGCGTGYTACLLAKEYDVNVVAADIRPKILELTKKRIAKERVGDKVETTEANAEKLKFQTETFDVVIAESVLVHCDSKKAVPEAYRVLKHDGHFGANELTYLKPPPAELLNLLLGSFLGGIIRGSQEHEWLAILRGAGFVDTLSTVSKINSLGQLVDHIKIDGFRRYLFAVIKGLLDPDMGGTFLKTDILKAYQQFSSYVGYGLYMGKKG